MKTKRKSKSIALFSMLAMILVGAGVSIINTKSPSVVNAATTIVLDKIGTGLGSDANTSIAQTTVSGYSLNYFQAKKQNDSMLLTKNVKSFVSNKTPIPGKITSVKVYINSGASGSTTYRVNFATSEILADPETGTAVKIAGGDNHTFTNSTNETYFVVSLGNNNNGQVLKLDITYESLAPASPLESLTLLSGPDKTDYFAGDDFDPTGVEIEATFENESTLDVSSLVTYSPTPLTVGQTSITASYKPADIEKSVSIEGLTVVAPEFYEISENFNSYANEITSGVLDSNWNWRGIKNDASTDTRTYGQTLRVYNKGEAIFEPSPNNTDYKMTSIQFKAVNAIKFSLRVGSSASDATQVKEVTPTANSTQTHTDNNGFRYVSILCTHGSSNLQMDDLVIKYKQVVVTYDDVVSLDSNFTEESIKVGELVSISPTILPTTANQGFTLSTESDGVEIVGLSTIKGVAAATNVSVEIKTVGKNASGNQLTKTITFDVIQATTTVAEALTLPPGGDIIYLVENAKVSDGYNTEYDRQIQLEDSVDPNKKILVFKYGINPIESYNYIAGGTITFKAKIGIYSSVNQFVDPITIISYTDRVEDFAASINAGNVEGQCLTRFAGYKTLVLSFTDIELDKFELSTNTAIVNARARYLAWALHMGEKPFESGTISQGYSPTTTSNNIAAIVIISVIGLTTLAGYYFFRKKKEA